MMLHPQIKKILEEGAEGNRSLNHSLSTDVLRRQMLAESPQVDPELSADRVAETTMPGPACTIPLRIYYPAGIGPFPVTMFFHGGAWTLGDLDTHDAICHAICNLSQSAVVAVNYRRAPEHPFPAAVEDCYEATAWIAQTGADLDLASDRLAVCGDSAGGNLATVVALIARDKGGPRLCAQVMAYPVVDHDFETSSYLRCAEGYRLTRAYMQWSWNNYVPDPRRRDTPYAAPLRATDLAGLPPALLITAEWDPLFDEGNAYARQLRAAGVATRLIKYNDMIHGFLRLTRSVNRAREALEEVASALRLALHSVPSEQPRA